MPFTFYFAASLIYLAITVASMLAQRRAEAWASRGVRLPTILWGALPFMLCMVVGIVLLCLFPGIATWLPEFLMGQAI